MNRRWTIAAAVMTLAGCGPGEPAPEPLPEPTGYSIRRVDLRNDRPADHCRQADREFVAKLMNRFDQALPIDARGSGQFEQFFVQQSFDGKGQEAVLRVRAKSRGQDELIFAVGPFEPEGCKVGTLSVYFGGADLAARGKPEFSVP